MTAWIRVVALGLVLVPFGCEVRVDNDGRGGFSGDDGYDVGGSGGDDGFGGDENLGGSGGDDVFGGSGGDDGFGGSGSEFPAPTCSDEPDYDDECIQCLKERCCDAWLACDDDACYSEWTGTAACVQQIDFPDEDQYAMCVSESSAAGDGLPQENTFTLLECMNTPDPDAGPTDTLCGVPCLGSEIFFE